LRGWRLLFAVDMSVPPPVMLIERVVLTERLA
jgi:hypothetical protein